jgi:hypothetical protein
LGKTFQYVRKMCGVNSFRRGLVARGEGQNGTRDLVLALGREALDCPKGLLEKLGHALQDNHFLVDFEVPEIARSRLGLR